MDFESFLRYGIVYFVLGCDVMYFVMYDKYIGMDSIYCIALS